LFSARHAIRPCFIILGRHLDADRFACQSRGLSLFPCGRGWIE
jgi:hypothetical protein